MSTVIDHLNNIRPLSPGLTNSLLTHLTHESFPPKQVMLPAGNPCKKLWFILRGLVASYRQNGNKSCCTGLYAEQSFLTVPGFLHQHPSADRLVALERTHTLYLHAEKLGNICHSFPEFQHHLFVLMHNNYVSLLENFNALHHCAPEERYRYMLAKHSALVLRVSVKDLASYIGVTQETLSRIRSRLT